MSRRRRDTSWRYRKQTCLLSARVVVTTVCGEEHRDGRPAIRVDFVVVLGSRVIEAGDRQEIGSFE
jgi:hypothetical protein